MELLTPTNSISGRHHGPRLPSPSPRTRRRAFRSLLNESERIVERSRTKERRAFQRSGEVCSTSSPLDFIQTQGFVHLAECKLRKL
ncbi:hypothetical protein CEXT_421051 [Caerostris extrusa]|uniref:Uncharacterized protein n=1 Tax=Caerostris extrusa TaxID=172846 RepID=A0AAV4S2C1_CAEEX|nr:hypothetical protein CEXT_421051 [Caerostris extrusa]